ncbi:MAG: glycosyltransferase family 39 protein [Acidimicrobiales bacterium]
MSARPATASPPEGGPRGSSPNESVHLRPRPLGSDGSGDHLAGVDLVLLLVLGLIPVAMAVWFRQVLSSGLWWDELWRAYHIALPGIQLDLHHTYAPTAPAWLYIEKLAVDLMGLHEWVLRLPSVTAWVLLGPVAYLLCRRAMSRTLAFVAGVAMAINPAMLYFGTELKPYVVEALATGVILLAWLRGRRVHGMHRFAWYFVIALASLPSIPASFVVAPLLACDLVRAAWHHRSEGRVALSDVVAALVAGALVVLPLALFVLPQPAGAAYGYFRFIPHGASPAVRAVASDLLTYASGAWTGLSLIASDTGLIPLSTAPSLLVGCADVGLFALVLTGAWHLRRRPLGQGLIAALVGSLLLETVASGLNRWPLGLTRINLFQLPLVLMLTVAGLSAVWKRASSEARSRKRDEVANRALSGVAFALGLALVLALGVQNASTISALHSDLPWARPGAYTKSVVAEARRLYRPGTLAVVVVDGRRTGCMDEPTGTPRGMSWIFYMDFYNFAGMPSSDRIPLASTYFATTSPHSAAGLPGFFARHPADATVVEYRELSGGRCVLRDLFLARAIRRHGYYATWIRIYNHSGEITVWHRRLRKAALLSEPIPQGGQGAG